MLSSEQKIAYQKKYQTVIAAYKRLGNMQRTADECKLTIGRVQQILQKHAPEIVHRQGVQMSYRKRW